MLTRNLDASLDLCNGTVVCRAQCLFATLAMLRNLKRQTSVVEATPRENGTLPGMRLLGMRIGMLEAEMDAAALVGGTTGRRGQCLFPALTTTNPQPGQS